MGDVWAAWDPTLARRVAIKIMKGTLVETTTFRQRFLAEARRHARLDHPNIPRVHDCFNESHSSCLVLQLIDGHSVDSMIEGRGALETRQAISIALDFLSALNYAH